MKRARATVGVLRAVQAPCVLCCLSSSTQHTRTFVSERIRVEKGHWGSLENQRSFLDEVAARLDIQEASSDLSAWKSVTSEQFRALGGGGLLNKYGGSLYRLLSSAYPKIAGDSSSASRRKLPNGYWKDIDNRKRFFEEVATSHAVEKDEDWKRVRVEDFVAAGGSGMLKLYGNSIVAAMSDTFPEKAWEELDVRPAASRGYWKKIENRRAFLDRFMKTWRDKRDEQGFATPPVGSKDFWKDVEFADICNMRGGACFMKHYRFSLVDALRELQPSQEWHAEAVRSRMPKHYWREKENVRRFLVRVARAKGLTDPIDWRCVMRSDIQEMGGLGLLDHYRTVFDALQAAFPEQCLWIEDCRQQIPRTHWEDDATVKEFITRAAKKLRIQEKSDWGRVSYEELRSLGAGSLLSSMTLSQALEIAYPNMGPWEFASEREKQRPRKCGQRSLAVTLAELLGGEPTLASGLPP